MFMQQTQDWREFLGRIIADSLERQRIATALNVNAITLSRWANASSTPRPENVRHLINALPQHQPQFLQLIASEFPEFAPGAPVVDQGPLEIPSPFYARILSTHADTSDSLYFWSMCKLILHQILEQLDSRRLGMLALIAQCTPPLSSGKVRSLRGSARLGTFPPSRSLEQEPLFFGAEALAGITASSCRPFTIQELGEQNSLLGFASAELASATSYPLLHKGRIAGCLISASTQYDYFTPERLGLIQDYANLLALAFQAEEFYDPGRIELGVMPSASAQKPYFASFRPRVAVAMKASSHGQGRLSSGDAEQLVWQEIEQELLQLASSAGLD
jgi:hypothetical protein